MSSNELVLLDKVLEQELSNGNISLPEDQAFEFFACEQVLKASDLSVDELTSGLIGGGGDGGIDGVFTFLDGLLLAEDSEVFDSAYPPSRFRQGVPLTLRLVQAKRSESFAERTIDLVDSSTGRLLDLQKPTEELLDLYSIALVERFDLFRSALERLAIRHPTVSIEFYYVTRGSTSEIHPNVLQKAEDLEDEFKLTATSAIGKVQFLGVSELLQSASTAPSYTLQLTYQENATSGTSHVAIVSLRDYMKFLSEENGSLRRHIFDWNVRDYQGNVKVNGEIRASLNDDASPEFWWLNNGVTVVCSKASIQGKTYTLDDVQIVNGLQTSYTIYQALSNAEDGHFALNRHLLVRILETEDINTRDRIIRATNSQTSVPEASLRATDQIQRQIERYFETSGWYYDRRKNYYRNLKKPADRIVGIPLLAQTVMAVGLSRPDTARARPSSLLKDDDDYRRVFSGDNPLEVYLWAARIQKQVDVFLQSDAGAISNPEKTNYRFHLAMLATAKSIGRPVVSPRELEELASAGTEFLAADLKSCLQILRTTMEGMMLRTGETADKIAKGREYVHEVLHAAQLS